LNEIKNEISLTQTTLNDATTIFEELDKLRQETNVSTAKLEKTVSEGFATIVDEMGKQGEKAAETAEKLSNAITSLNSVVYRVQRPRTRRCHLVGESTILNASKLRRDWKELTNSHCER
jgi:hypothetical protein